MAERVTLTAEQAQALQELRAKHREESLSNDQAAWVPVDEDTGPHKVLAPLGTG
jgi:hypothetical protein